jgi:CPA1 family monovalent cation:H+ antiporter
MVGFVLNGLIFVLIGLALPDILEGLGHMAPERVLTLALLVSAAVIGTRFVYVFLASLLPNSPRRLVARDDPRLATRLTFLVAWSGLRGAVSLAAALALPLDFPERSLIQLVTFAVILATLVGQGLTLPLVVRWVGWDGRDPDGDEGSFARQTVYRLGLDAVTYSRTRWPDHGPLLDRLESGLGDRMQHLSTEDEDEDQTEERRREHREHGEIQLYVINAQRAAAIALRDAGEINDATLRELERELDLEELRMEA